LKHLFIQKDEASKFPEMYFNLQSYIHQTSAPQIEIIIPKTQDELLIWTITAISTLGIEENDFKQFFYPLIDIANCTPLLLYYNKQPAGTAMVYCGNQVAGIYAMSTKEEFRRKKIGTIAVHACLKIAKAHELKYAVLYASHLGAKLYNSTEFEVIQHYYEFDFNNNSK
jgi:ribosomal protein S18 acetylase RimI-like enzyme